MTSWSENEIHAKNAISFGSDDELSFVSQYPKFNKTISVSIQYPIDRVLLGGVLYSPRIMEDRWGVFYNSKTIIFVRSWLREVMVIAKVKEKENFIEVYKIQVIFTSDKETNEQNMLYLDFLVKNLAYGRVYPVPISEEQSKNSKEALNWCFSIFGRIYLVATHYSIPKNTMEIPLRSISLFQIAIAKDDYDTVVNYIKNGTPVNLLSQDGKTPLQWALAVKRFKNVEFLLEHGAQIDEKSTQGATSLMTAVQSQDIDLIKYLIDKKANVNAQDNKGFTSLHRSAEMGFTEITKLLLNNRADKDISSQGFTALDLAKKEIKQRIYYYYKIIDLIHL